MKAINPTRIAPMMTMILAGITIAQAKPISMQSIEEPAIMEYNSQDVLEKAVPT